MVGRAGAIVEANHSHSLRDRREYGTGFMYLIGGGGGIAGYPLHKILDTKYLVKFLQCLPTSRDPWSIFVMVGNQGMRNRIRKKEDLNPDLTNR